MRDLLTLRMVCWRARVTLALLALVGILDLVLHWRP